MAVAVWAPLIVAWTAAATMLARLAGPAVPAGIDGPIPLPRPARAPSVIRRWAPPIGVAASLVVALLLAVQGRTEHWVTFHNVSNEPVEVLVGGDRVLIIKPHASEALPVSPRGWSWPRRIEVRRYPRGERLLTWRADLNDLAQQHWQVRVP